MSLAVAILAILSLVTGIGLGAWVGFSYHRRTLLDHLKSLELSGAPLDK